MAETQDPPFLSFNQDITQHSELGQAPTAEELESMKKRNPKLGSTWTIWEQVVPPKDAPKSAYSDATHEVLNFDTAKKFWECWKHMPQPSELLNGKKFMRVDGQEKIVIDSIMIFRKGIKPEWEAKENANGGHFQLQLKPELGGGTVDEVWNNIVLGMVSGGMVNSDMINGVRLVDKLHQKMKPGIRIEVWYNDESDSDKLYDLRGGFERCMRTRLDGSLKTASWGYTETKSHKKQ